MSIVKRMKQAREEACFTVSDMALWYTTSRAAMSSWIVGDHEPQAGTQKLLEPPTDLLEKALSKGLFPIPLSVRQRARKAYIEKVQENVAGRISKAGSTTRRKEVLGRPKGKR